ncbi:MAG TPA: hypothetical protein PLR71_04150 [Deltaproteobacteria bacterium]|nr:hypothetical protein [Deltaproteobacteria bacterium]HQI80733.1 hypothetical protein [Deltaproteobacteria bacterium]
MQGMMNQDIPLKKKRLYGPDVHLVRRGGQNLVEKTYRHRPPPVRVLGRILVRWETFIYSKLGGIPGIPRVTPGPDPFTLCTTYMGGHNLKSGVKIPDAAYFDALERLMADVHSRGVIHLDLRNRRNYGMDEEGRPYLVDFASSVYLPWRGPLWRVLCAVDRMGYLKIKAKLNPDLLAAEERRGRALGNILSTLWIPPRVFRFLRDILGRIAR